MKRFGAFVACLLIGGAVWLLVTHYSFVPPVKPATPHDPFKLGYPDSPDKPRALREAELVVLEEWPAVIDCLRHTSRNGIRRGCRRNLAESYLYDDDPTQLEKRVDCTVAALCFLSALKSYEKHGNHCYMNSRDMAKEIGNYLILDFLEGELGYKPKGGYPPGLKKKDE